MVQLELLRFIWKFNPPIYNEWVIVLDLRITEQQRVDGSEMLKYTMAER